MDPIVTPAQIKLSETYIEPLGIIDSMARHRMLRELGFNQVYI